MGVWVVAAASVIGYIAARRCKKLLNRKHDLAESSLIKVVRTDPLSHMCQVLDNSCSSPVETPRNLSESRNLSCSGVGISGQSNGNVIAGPKADSVGTSFERQHSSIDASNYLRCDLVEKFDQDCVPDLAEGELRLEPFRTAKEHQPRTSYGSSSVSPSEASRTLKSTQSSTRSQQLPKESTSGSVKSSGSIRPRLQANKLEPEKRSWPPTPPDSNRSRR